MQTINSKTIPYRADSALLFDALRDMPEAIWLDSGQPQSTQGRFDIISASPDSLIETHGAVSTITDHKGTTSSDQDPFVLANQLMESLQPIDDTIDAPFVGGLLGYFSYDLVRHSADDNSTNSRVTTLPDMRVGRYLWSLIVDHQTASSRLYFHEKCPITLRQDVCQRLESVTTKPEPQPINNSAFKLLAPFRATLSQSQYHSAIASIKDYILSGDCYQVNFTQHLSAKYQGDLWQAYLCLRNAVPSPYSVYWQWADKAVLSLSPERFIKSEVANGQIDVESKPIKGTILRGANAEQDKSNAEQLLNSSKDRAENLMIVDLLRNDLGKNCQPGSIRVPKLFNLESFPNVHHLVSTVTGVLRPDRSVIDLLRDSFPGGSITGAPKKRAMEIIDELEPVKRSVYCGSIGYISASNRMDTNIAIRTLVADHDQLHCWGGGGIVADSQADKEFEESLNKVRLLLQTLEDL